MNDEEDFECHRTPTELGIVAAIFVAFIILAILFSK